jgi:membrane protease subunit HflC
MRSAAGVLIGLFVILFGANLVSFTVTEVQQVVVTQFGEKIRVITEPGLYFKYPDPIQKTTYFDKWLLEYDAEPEQVFTRDKKMLVLDNYARWRIIDPYLFMQSLQTVDRALKRLRDIVKSELLKELGRHELSEVVALNRESIMELVTARCDSTARTFGIEILDVRVKRADLPPENEAAVFERMRAEREREAKGYRSEGEERALEIRADTDLEAAQIKAAAYEESQRIRGEGDAEALRIYAAAYTGAEEFYEFSRTLEAYEQALDENTVLVQPMDTDFFKYLQGK